MKFCAVAAVLLVSIFATSMALPARFAYYQQPSFYYQSRSAPQRLMYLQYVQQPSSSQTHARLTNAAAAFVAGDTVATGTYLKDDASVEQQVAEESGAQSVAEAYPADDEPQDDDTEVAGADIAESEVPETPELPEENQVLEDEDTVAEEETVETGRELSAEANPEPAVEEPAVPEIPEPSEEVPEEAANDDDEDADEDVPAPTNNRRQVAPAPKAAPAPLPAGTFFPIDFGGTSGGAIAIANSFSTGEGGTAKSQAIAYGKPEPSRTKSRPIRRH